MALIDALRRIFVPALAASALGCSSSGDSARPLGARAVEGPARDAGGEAGKAPPSTELLDAPPEPLPEDDGGPGPVGSFRDGGAPSADAAPFDAAPCASGVPRFVTGVREHAFGPGQSTGQDEFPAPLLGAPRGAGCCQGSFDVVSLGNGGFVVVEFGEGSIVDGPGPDFIVFENAFWAGGDESSPFAELATVSVSEDGIEWHAFPCTATEAPFDSCAGQEPVFANADENDIDPLDPSVAGGDAFDLADIGVARARFVRIEDRPDLDGLSGTFDLDAVGIVNAACP